MIGKKKFQPKGFYMVSIEDLVPEDNFYRQLNKILKLHFLYKEVEHLYGTRGQKSLDPVVFFKLQLVGYLENIQSDRKLARFAADSLGVRLFLEYDIDEKFPWHSTISRTRQLIPETLYIKVFDHILDMCIDNGLVEGKTQAIDSTLVSANASMDSLEPRRPQLEAHQYIRKTYQENSESEPTEIKSDEPADNNLKPTLSVCKSSNPESNRPIRARRGLSNEDYRSPTDPDSRIMAKQNTPRDLYYLSTISVDTRNNIITHIRANHADQRDSELFTGFLDEVSAKLFAHQLYPETILADKGYGSGPNYRHLQLRAMTGYVPYREIKQKPEGFIYLPDEDVYICPEGKRLVYRSTHAGKQVKIYCTSTKDCKACPHLKTCANSSGYKYISHSVYLEAHQQMRERLSTPLGRWMLRLRMSTVEPVFGTLKDHHGMRRVNTRGISSANKNFLIAGAAYNLRKLMKSRFRKSFYYLSGRLMSFFGLFVPNCLPKISCRDGTISKIRYSYFNQAI